MSLPPELQAVHDRLNTDLPYFMAEAPLLIKDKEGVVKPFVMNRAQRFIHARLEKQLKERGFIRACILKGRQQGCSTYVSARFYHKTTRKPGVSTFILSHEGKTTDKLFRMVKRYQENITPALRPAEGASNRNQLFFSELDSDYAVGTAGNENVGRGGTAQLIHGSEAAYWEKADEIQDGLLNSIGRVPGTEVILESTANGPIGLFYRKCQDALNGVGDYQLIFVPWFWQDEYEAPYNGEALSEDEETFLSQYLMEFPRAQALRKIMWRRVMVVDLRTGDNPKSGLAKFHQIYPSNPIEAFQTSGIGLMRPEAIMEARKSKIFDETAPLIIGVDSAGESDDSDRTIIAWRRGRHLEKVQKYARMGTMELAGILAKIINDEHPDMVFMDRGYGQGTIDRLHELGFRRQVIGVAFNERPLEPDIYLNKRSEILITLASWVNAGGVRIPDDDEIHADFAVLPIDQETSNGLKYLASKREIKKVLGRSPDIADAVALTFSYPVRRQTMGAVGGKNAVGGWTKKDGGKSPLKSRRR